MKEKRIKKRRRRRRKSRGDGEIEREICTGKERLRRKTTTTNRKFIAARVVWHQVGTVEVEAYTRNIETQREKDHVAGKQRLSPPHRATGHHSPL